MRNKNTLENLDLFATCNLTRSQFLVWVGQKLNPDAPLYNMAITYQINGPLDLTVMQSAYQKVVDQSDALRTIIEEIDGVPMQRVLPRIVYEIKVLDYKKKSDPLAACEIWAQLQCKNIIDIEECMFDCALIRVADDITVWYINQHHLVVDGWSTTVLFKRVSQLYDYLISGKDTSTIDTPVYESYRVLEKDFRRTPAYKRSIDYWTSKACQEIEPLVFYNQPSVGSGTRTARVYCELGLERSEKIRKIALRDDVRSLTSDMTLLGIFSALLFTWQYKVTRQSNLALGTFGHNRNRKPFKEVPGMFIELFPLFATIERQESFLSLIQKLGKEVLGFLAHAQPGTGNILPEQSSMVILNFINASLSEFAGYPITSHWVHPGHGDLGHALRLQVHDFDNTGNFKLHFDFNEDVFSPSMREFASQHFMQIVDAFIESPETELGAIDLLGFQNRNYVLNEFNQYPVDGVPGETVVEMFERQVGLYPEQTAVDYLDTKLSYQALDEQSTLLALKLTNSGFGRGDIAAIVCLRSIDLVVAILAVLKTAGSYVPIDPGYPQERIELILKDTSADLVLSQSFLRQQLPDFCDPILLDELGQLPSEERESIPSKKAGMADRAYLMYTSGSTGTPKGVEIGHAALSNYLEWAKKQYIGKNRYNLPLFSSISADLTVTSLFLPIICGGTIVVYGEKQSDVDLSILDLIEDDKVDILKLTPSHLALLVSAPVKNSRIKSIIVGGEQFDTSLARKVVDQFSRELDIYNEYGPTEATVGCMIHRFDSNADCATAVPIGKPVDNMQVYLLDNTLNPVPFGFEGELYVSGRALATGYLNQADLTNEKFLDNPFNPGTKMYRTGDMARWTLEGTLEYSGRMDDQVKIRGFRIELGEIEASLNSHAQVSDCVVSSMGQATRQEHELQYCLECGLESRHPDAKINTDGICQICVEFKQQKRNASHYFKTKKDLVALFTETVEHSAIQQDCIVLLSGGKDSTYVLYQVVKMGLTPLVFSLDNGYISEQAKANIETVVSGLNLELVWGKTPAMNEIFVDSLKRFSNVCNGCHKVIYTLSVNLALERGIRYIVTGLSRGQFFETRVSPFFKNNVFASSQIDEEIIEARKAYHRMDDAVSRCIDVSAFKDDAVFEKVQFVDYYRYSDVSLGEMLRFLENDTAWVRPDDTGRSTNCLINEAGIYVHKKERQFHNYSLPYSWDVRLGHKERGAALEELDDDIDEDRVKQILAEIGYSVPEQPDSQQRLVAYYMADEKIPASRLKAYLKLKLPAHMLPSHFMHIDSIPLNATGKRDRAALPMPGDRRETLETDYLAPRNATEELLAGIWSSVMGINKIGVNDNFFDLGGDSILNIQIVAGINRAGYSAQSAQLFSHPTISGLASVVRPAENTLAIPEGGVPKNESETFPAVKGYGLSPLQQGLLFHAISSSESEMYVEQYYCTLQGTLDDALFQQSWEKVVERHAVLRTAILWQNQTKPIQEERSGVSANWLKLDWQNYTGTRQKCELDSWLNTDSRAGFDLSRAPLTRFALMQLSKNRWYFVWSFHHIILDGWSSQIILKEVYEHYQALTRNECLVLSPVPSYRKYIDSLNKIDQSPAGLYWAETLNGYSQPVRMRDYDAPLRGIPSLEKHNITIEGDLLADMEVFTRNNRLTMNSLLQAAWAITLGRYASSKDVVFGATVSGRQLALDNIDSMTGLFINTLPVRVALDSSNVVIDWLQKLQSNLIEMREFESSALVDIKKVSSLSPGVDLFQSIFVFENRSLMARTDSRMPFRTLDISYRDQSNFALSVLVIQQDDIELLLQFDSDQFTSGFMRRVGSSIENTLRQLIENPHSKLASLSVLSVEDTQKYLVGINQTQKQFQDELALHQLIERQADVLPDKPALYIKGAVVNYAELNARANQLANELVKSGTGKGDLVALHLERSADMVIAMLAVLKSGAAYVPLDPAYPLDRLAFMVQDANARVVITHSYLACVPTDSRILMIELDTQWLRIGGNASVNLARHVAPSDLAYVMYTSGSTGQPKGVMVSHSNVVNSTCARIDYYHPVERFLLLTSISFDSSVAGVYWTLSQGGCLYIPDPDKYGEADHIVQMIQDHSITHLLCIPSLWQELLDLAVLSSLDTVIVAGEVCPPKLPGHHYMVLPSTKLYNEYGPTEGTVWSTVFDCAEDWESKSVPIGSPIANVQVFVLDEGQSPVSIGTPGELYIGGSGVAQGYLNGENQTAERFVQPPGVLQTRQSLYRTGDIVRMLANGCLEFLGRKDQQVKLRGYRVELGEIESVLSRHSDIDETAVVMTGNSVLETSHVGESDVGALARQLKTLDEFAALALLNEVAGESAENFHTENVRTADFELQLQIKNRSFISPPRETQRNWLLYQLLGEVRDDLEYLDKVAMSFVPGKGTHLDALEVLPDEWSKDQIMEDWQTPLMKAMARNVSHSHGDVLEIGYGRGVSAEFIQQCGVKSHTVIEANPECIEKYYHPWRAKHSAADIRLVSGMWQEVLEQLELYDGVFFHTFPMDEQEFIDYVMDSITFAEHFFSVASSLLRPGGVFTYLTTEIDSLSRRHQRALFKHFSSISMHVEAVRVPIDTADSWWAQSMVVIRATK